MLGNRTNEQWIAQYSTSHQHPINRACHTLGIPTILISVALFAASIFLHRLWPYATILFLLGWTLQFIGHAFERKAPEFFHDWRFLFVGVRWWWAKIRGQGTESVERRTPSSAGRAKLTRFGQSRPVAGRNNIPGPNCQMASS